MESSRLIDTLEIRDFSKKMNATYGFLRQNFRSFWKCMLLIAGPPIIIGGIFSGDIFNRFMSASTTRAINRAADQYEYFETSMFWLQLLGIFLFLCIGAVVVVSTTYGYLSAYHDHKRKEIPLSEVWAKVRKGFWRTFWTMFLYALISGVAIIVVTIPVALISSYFTSAWIIGVVLMIALIVSTTHLAINFFMIFICREMESQSFGNSVQRIIHLLKGKTWSTYGITLTNLYIQYGISMIALVPWIVVQAIVVNHVNDAGEAYRSSGLLSTFNLIFIIAYFLFYMLLSAIPMIGIGFQYFNLVESKESQGLMKNIESFGTETETLADEHY